MTVDGDTDGVALRVTDGVVAGLIDEAKKVFQSSMTIAIRKHQDVEIRRCGLTQLLRDRCLFVDQIARPDVAAHEAIDDVEGVYRSRGTEVTARRRPRGYRAGSRQRRRHMATEVKGEHTGETEDGTIRRQHAKAMVVRGFGFGSPPDGGAVP